MNDTDRKKYADRLRLPRGERQKLYAAQAQMLTGAELRADRLGYLQYTEELNEGSRTEFRALLDRRGLSDFAQQHGDPAAYVMLLRSRPRPLVTIGCPARSHPIGGVHGTPGGALFVSRPTIFDQTESASRVSTVYEEGSRHLLVVDIVDQHVDDPRHPVLRGSCRCGLHQVDRAEVLRSVEVARRSGPVRLRLDPAR